MFPQLTEEIIRLSVGITWDTAKLEWELVEIYEAPNNTCLCGHHPITEICVLQNQLNSNRAEVGNCCVKKFTDRASKVLRAIERVRADDTRALNAESVDHAYEQGWISEWEYDFYMDTLRERKLSWKQLAKRQEINSLIVEAYTKPLGE